VPRKDWPLGLDEDIAPLWREPYGDRQVELVCIGSRLDNEAAEALLVECLVTDAEFEGGPEVWAQLVDPFAAQRDRDIALDTDSEAVRGGSVGS